MIDNRALKAFEVLWENGYQIKKAIEVSGLSLDEVKSIAWEIHSERMLYRKPVYSKADFGIPIDWQTRKRKNYLTEQINASAKVISEIKKLYPFWAKNSSDAGYLIYLGKKTKADLEKMKKELAWISKPNAIKVKSVNQGDIEAARNVDILSVLPHGEINRSGFTVCFLHEDKKPSLKYYQKSNKVHCFVCNKSFDTIDVVMYLHGCDFIYAVKILNGLL